MAPPSKKSKVTESGVGEGSGHVDEKLLQYTSKIKYIQKELKKINVEEDSKVLEVLQKYSEIRREIYTRRNEVFLTITEFWLTVFLNHPVLGKFLNVEDKKILNYLVSLDVEERLKLGYSITLNFSVNPFFENEKLTKTYSFTDESTAVVTGATIKWKEGSDKGLEDMSFFMWLSRTQQIPVSAVALDKIACTIKGCVWPDPLKYILDPDNSLNVEGGVQNVDEEGEGGEINVEEGGHHDDEIREKMDEESGEIDVEGVIYDDEIEEAEGDEESGEIDVEEGEEEDDEIEEQEEEEEGSEADAEEGGLDDDESEELEGEETDAEHGWLDDDESEEPEGEETDAEEGGDDDEIEVQEGVEEAGEADGEEGGLDDDDEIEEHENDEGVQDDDDDRQEDDED